MRNFLTMGMWKGWTLYLTITTVFSNTIWFISFLISNNKNQNVYFLYMYIEYTRSTLDNLDLALNQPFIQLQLDYLHFYEHGIVDTTIFFNLICILLRQLKWIILLPFCLLAKIKKKKILITDCSGFQCTFCRYRII